MILCDLLSVKARGQFELREGKRLRDKTCSRGSYITQNQTVFVLRQK